MTFTLTETIARKVIEVVDCGLVSGPGQPKPGAFCVEAAVCYALGLPHGDDPGCVAASVRSLKIRLNDSSWSSPAARAKGLRRLAIAQLGSLNVLDEAEFVRLVARLTIQKYVPKALRAAASIHPDQKHKDALEAVAIKCEKTPTARAAADAAAADAARAAAYAADAAADAADAADAELAGFAEDVVQVLVALKAPGCAYLYLTD